MHQSTSSLRSQSVLLHRKLKEQLLMCCQDREQRAEQKLNSAVHTTDAFLNQLYELVPDFFENPDEEILFFKAIKPLFSVEKEYHQRLYHAALFGEGDNGFYAKELVRMGRLEAEYAVFADYYRNGYSHHDHLWFVQGQAPEPTSLCMDKWETVPKYTSMRDSWVSGLLAVERYKEWLVLKQKN